MKQKTTVNMIKKEIEDYIKACEKSIEDMTKDNMNCDYTIGYRDGLQMILDKINGKEKMYSRDF